MLLQIFVTTRSRKSEGNKNSKNVMSKHALPPSASIASLHNYMTKAKWAWQLDRHHHENPELSSLADSRLGDDGGSMNVSTFIVLAASEAKSGFPYRFIRRFGHGTLALKHWDTFWLKGHRDQTIKVTCLKLQKVIEVGVAFAIENQVSDRRLFALLMKCNAHYQVWLENNPNGSMTKYGDSFATFAKGHGLEVFLLWEMWYLDDYRACHYLNNPKERTRTIKTNNHTKVRELGVSEESYADGFTSHRLAALQLIPADVDNLSGSTTGVPVTVEDMFKIVKRQAESAVKNGAPRDLLDVLGRYEYANTKEKDEQLAIQALADKEQGVKDECFIQLLEIVNKVCQEDRPSDRNKNLLLEVNSVKAKFDKVVKDEVQTSKFEDTTDKNKGTVKKMFEKLP